LNFAYGFFAVEIGKVTDRNEIGAERCVSSRTPLPPCEKRAASALRSSRLRHAKIIELVGDSVAIPQMPPTDSPDDNWGGELIDDPQFALFLSPPAHAQKVSEKLLIDLIALILIGPMVIETPQAYQALRNALRNGP